MSIAGSVTVTGFIAPSSAEDVYPVTNPSYGLGGWRRVDTVNERNTIPVERREAGMVVYVEGDNAYVLRSDLVTWDTFGDAFIPQYVHGLYPSPWGVGEFESLGITDRNGDSIYV